MRHSAFVVLCLIAALCSCSAAQDKNPHDDSISLEDWASETFALPPGFAQELPTGTESLRFAPGWRDPSSENFWSYCFVMSIDEPAPDATRIDELLETYYNGLMLVFAGNRDKDIGSEPARVEVTRTTENHFEAKMHTIDAFATFEPIDIRVVVETVADTDEHSFVRIQVSKQPKEHDIWRSLEAAVTSIGFPDGASEEKNDTEAAISLEVLKERSEYAALDKEAVEALARAAQVRWAKELSGFTYQRVEHFAAGGVSHWMSIWLHEQTGLEFVMVPGGKFLMGSPADEPERRDDELQHWVTLDPFLIARTECTQEAWAKIARSESAIAAGLRGAKFEGSGQLPMSGIGPVDVEAWCHEANLSFPTEAQWEYMCRAGTSSAWTTGADKKDLARFANLGSLECPKQWLKMKGMTEPWQDGYGNETAKVGTFSYNAFGLYDVHGNLNEWVRDYYFSYEEVTAENGTGERRGDSGERSARGGSYGGGASAARSAKRLTAGSGGKAGDGGNHGFGFRPSLDLPY